MTFSEIKANAAQADAQWARIRGACLGCKHVLQRGPSMQCSLAQTRKTPRAGKVDFMYCIDARGIDERCGPSALRWEQK